MSAGADTVTRPPSLQAHLEERRQDGRKLLLPYVTAGVVPDWVELVDAVIEAGADAVEIGIPFSDPAMDGPTIQAASDQALANGITPGGALDALRDRDHPVPLIAMTYYNLVYRHGLERFAADLALAGLSATILPDLPPESAGEWEAAADAHGIENVLLAAPVSTDDRLAMLGRRTKGFLYAVSTMGTTGERDQLDQAASVLATRVQAATDVPVLIGFGISTPEHAVTAAKVSDGVITASALMRTLLDGGSIDDVAAQVAAMRSALDA